MACPMVMLVIIEKLLSALAALSRRMGTRFGIAAMTAGRKKAFTTPLRTPAATRQPTFNPTASSITKKATPTSSIDSPSTASPITISRRRENRSAIAPPTGPSSTPGMAPAIDTSPIVVAEPVACSSQ